MNTATKAPCASTYGSEEDVLVIYTKFSTDVRLHFQLVTHFAAELAMSWASTGCEASRLWLLRRH